MSLPYPAHQWFTDHCWYRFKLEPGAIWSSMNAVSGDGDLNPVSSIHGGTVLHLEDLSNGMSETLFVAIYARQRGTIVLTSDGGAMKVTAHDSDDAAVDVRPAGELGFEAKPRNP